MKSASSEENSIRDSGCLSEHRKRDSSKKKMLDLKWTPSFGRSFVELLLTNRADFVERHLANLLGCC